MSERAGGSRLPVDKTTRATRWGSDVDARLVTDDTAGRRVAAVGDQTAITRRNPSDASRTCRWQRLDVSRAGRWARRRRPYRSTSAEARADPRLRWRPRWPAPRTRPRGR